MKSRIYAAPAVKRLMVLRPLTVFNPLSARSDFWRQILTSKVAPALKGLIIPVISTREDNGFTATLTVETLVYIGLHNLLAANNGLNYVPLIKLFVYHLFIN